MFGEERLREVAARIAACAGDPNALAAIDAELARRPEPDARRLRFKIADLQRRIRQSSGVIASCAPVGAPAPIATLPPFRAGAWAALLARARLKAPDGRPLHRYHLDEGEHELLREQLRHRAQWGLAAPHDETAALFVLWAAHWFQREYRGGMRRWEDVRAALGAPFDDNQARDLTKQGLKAWKRPAVRADGETHTLWLRSLAVEGGFPAGLLDQADGWTGRYLTRLVGVLLALDPLDEASALKAAEAQADLAPKAYRQEIFYAFAADLGTAVVRLRREVEGDERARGLPVSAWLDAIRPGWRDELPVRAGSVAAARLVDGLMGAKAIGLSGDGRIGCERVLRHLDGVWRPALRFGLDGVAKGEIAERLKGRRERLRAHPAGLFARHAAGELAMFEPPAEGDDGWRVQPSRRDPLVQAVPFAVPVEVELRFDGRPVARAAWPGGEAVRGDVAVFAPDEGAGDTLTLIGHGSGSYKPEPLVVALPPDWTIRPYDETAAIEPFANTVEDGRRLWRAAGAAILCSPEGDTYRIAAGQSGARRDQLLIDGVRPYGLESDEAEIELFAGAPSVRVSEGRHVRSGRSGEIRWRPEGERSWRLEPFGTGRIDVGWRDLETGYLRDRRRIVVLPAGARLGCRPEGTAAVYTPEGFGTATLSPAGADLTVEHRGGDLVARFAKRPSRRALFTLHIGAGRPSRVSAPFPLRSGIARWSGEALCGSGSAAAAPSLPLSELAACVAFGEGAHVLHARLLDRNRTSLPGGAARWAFADELPLRGVCDDLAALLRPLADIDVAAELTFDHGAEYWLVRQFEAVLALGRSGRIASIEGPRTDETLPLVGRSTSALATEEVLGASTPADRLDQRPPLLPETLSGTWLLYLRRGDAVIARPSIARFGPGPTVELEGLAGALAVAEKAWREEAILTRFDDIAAGTPGGEADTRWLAALIAGLRGLPPASLDAMRLLPRRPGAAARVALHAREAEREAVLALSDSLPFAWCLVGHADWLRAAKVEEDALAAGLTKALGASIAQDLARKAVQGAAAKLVEQEPLLGWPLCAAGLTPPPPLQGGGLMDAARDHIRRHGDRVSEGGPRTSLFRAGQRWSLPQEFLTVFDLVHLETLDAPCAAACAAACGERPSDDAVRRIKTAARADPLYFAAAFEAQFVRLAR